MTDLEKFFYEKAKKVACKYYKTYKQIYKNDLLSKEDLIQEANLTVLEVLNNKNYIKKKEKELKKIINQALRFKLNTIRNTIVRRRTIFVKKGWQVFLEYFNIETDSITTDNVEFTKYEEFHNDYATDIEEKLLCEQALEFLTEEEFNVMYKTIVEGKSFRETAEDLNMSHPTVSKINKIIKEKIRKFNDNIKEV